MSWSKTLSDLAALALAGALAGCFQPLYSEAAHPGLVEDQKTIEVKPIKDRIGHYLADNLTTDLNGTGQTPTPKYKLTVTVSTATSTPTVSSLTNVATSATTTATATYTLNKVDGGAQVLIGVADANASYDRSQQRYADLRAAREHRDSLGACAGAGDLCEEIRRAVGRENPMRAATGIVIARSEATWRSRERKARRLLDCFALARLEGSASFDALWLAMTVPVRADDVLSRRAGANRGELTTRQR